MRKIIDDRGRLFGLVSVIDVVVLVAVIVLAFAVFTKFNVRDNPLTMVNTVPVTYTVKFPLIRGFIPSVIHIGDDLYTDTGAFAGTITDVFVEDAENAEWIIDGTYVIAKAQERYDVTLTVSAQCSFSNGRYYADRVFELNANAEQRFQTKYMTSIGYIMTITPD